MALSAHCSANDLQQYVGIPYADLDCYALVCRAALELYGLKFPTFPDYVANAETIISGEMTGGNWKPISKYDARSGDVVTLSPMAGGGRHVGLVVAPNLILHTTINYGSMVQAERGLRIMGFVEINYFRFRQ